MQHDSIHICWMPTKKIVADSRTKELSSAQKHDFVLRMTSIEDQKDLLASIKGEDDALQ